MRTASFAKLVEALGRDYDIYAPVQEEERLLLQRLVPGENGGGASVAWNPARLGESLKPIWFQTSRVVSRWTAEGPEAGPTPRPRAIIGAKGCDLAALGIIDKVFRDHTFQEPGWCAAREQNLVISGDCTTCLDSCFCTMVGHAPHPEAHFDLNLSPLEGGFGVEVGSPKGEALVADHADLFEEAGGEQVAARDAARAEMTERVEAQNEPHAVRDPFAQSIEKHKSNRLWEALAATCVQCNACNMVCPTCHCFFLVDVAGEEGSSRLSCWDSCFEGGYARMAGGGTPRLQLVERFKNHYHHKFVSFPKNWGVTACSGCGRCIDACMGRIDKRACLHRLETEWLPSDTLQGVQ
ncbi:MAG: 4Fe-4S dicluster domain-containing protein [Planctomycetota bacterium]|nr:4Fe-4S dicluster domain-containing protein [Planctomycetota bacterium]